MKQITQRASSSSFTFSAFAPTKSPLVSWSAQPKIHSSFLSAHPGIKYNATLATTEAGSALVFKRFATKKTGGSSKNGRTSNPKYLGPKKSNGQEVKTGQIIMRQRGTKWHAGEGVAVGRDHTLYALSPGVVEYTVSHFPVPNRKIIRIVPLEEAVQIRLEQMRNRPSIL